MKISDKEEKLISSGKLKAVIRWQNIDEKVGDPLFCVDGNVYILKEKKRWSVHRCAAKRSSDLGCTTVKDYILVFDYLYVSYNKHRKDVVYDVIFKPDERQRTLGGT